MMDGTFAATMLVAFIIDAALGWPEAVYRRIGHPVTWLGALITLGDTHLNRASKGTRARRIAGTGLALGIIALTAVLAHAIARLLPGGVPGIALGGALAWPLVATRSLHDHVLAVARPLANGDLAGARHAVSMIVGRNPDLLDSAGIGRAATESLAENTSDGIVAPLFWGVIFGLPGIAAYKAINTMDSMIGHRTPRQEAFGWAAARIDDIANLVPARLTGLIVALSSGHFQAAMSIMLRDARRHRSPNAGWPEAAFAGALGIRLSGPRVYAGHVANEPWLNGDAPDPEPRDLLRSLSLYRRAMVLLAVMLAAIALAEWTSRLPLASP